MTRGPQPNDHSFPVMTDENARQCSKQSKARQILEVLKKYIPQNDLHIKDNIGKDKDYKTKQKQSKAKQEKWTKPREDHIKVTYSADSDKSAYAYHDSRGDHSNVCSPDSCNGGKDQRKDCTRWYQRTTRSAATGRYKKSVSDSR